MSDQVQPGVPSTLPITIRPAEAQDYAFILSSWSTDAHRIKYDSFIPNSIFFPRHKAFINKIISRSIVNIAHVDGEKDIICGYIIIEPKFEMNTLLVHWAHVKPHNRRDGICKALFNNYLQDANPIIVATSPFTLLPDMKRKYGVIYDPSHVDSLRVS